MTKSQHTPTPWKWEPGRLEILDAIGKHALVQKNAAFIVRACNAHDALVEALEALVAVQDEYDELSDDGSADVYAALEDFSSAADKARAALKLAKEG